MSCPPTAAVHGDARSDVPLPSWWQRRVLACIVWYQRVVEGRPSPCRFTPSCSAYAYEAIALHGTRRGGLLTLRRLLRCRPFGPSGFDPVPESNDAGHVEKG